VLHSAPPVYTNFGLEQTFLQGLMSTHDRHQASLISVNSVVFSQELISETTPTTQVMAQSLPHNFTAMSGIKAPKVPYDPALLGSSLLTPNIISKPLQILYPINIPMFSWEGTTITAVQVASTRTTDTDTPVIHLSSVPIVYSINATVSPLSTAKAPPCRPKTDKCSSN
jgi:hypothetical protein